jgi:pilus assembly protein Flp/PilA
MAAPWRESHIDLTASKRFHRQLRANPNRRKKDRWWCSNGHTRTYRSYSMKSLVSRFVEDPSGATAIEYSLIAAGIAIAIIAVVNAIGTQLTATFSSVSAGFAN